MCRILSLCSQRNISVVSSPPRSQGTPLMSGVMSNTLQEELIRAEEDAKAAQEAAAQQEAQDDQATPLKVAEAAMPAASEEPPMPAAPAPEAEAAVPAAAAEPPMPVAPASEAPSKTQEELDQEERVRQEQAERVRQEQAAAAAKAREDHEAALRAKKEELNALKGDGELEIHSHHGHSMVLEGMHASKFEGHNTFKIYHLGEYMGTGSVL